MKQHSELKLRQIEEILHNLVDGSIHIRVIDGKVTEIDTAYAKTESHVT